MQLSPMGDNYSPPEDASQNQNYQQLFFCNSTPYPPCLHIRLRWLTHPYVLANAGGCVRRCRRECFLSGNNKKQSRSLVHWKAQENTGNFNFSADDNKRKEYLTRCHYGKEHYLETGHSVLGHYPDRYWHYAGGYFVLVGARGRRKGLTETMKRSPSLIRLLSMAGYFFLIYPRYISKIL